MAAVYTIDTGDEDSYPYGGLLEASPESNAWLPSEFMTRAAFEEAEHDLLVLDAKERGVPSEKLHDIEEVDPRIFAFSERAWPMLDDLVADGCRVAEKVKASGKGRFKLVCPGQVLDLLDYEASEVVDGEDYVSTVRKDHLYETDDTLPMMFHVCWKGCRQTRRSMRVYVTERFVARYDELGLTGADFILVPRTKR